MRRPWPEAVVVLVILMLCNSSGAAADDVTLIAPASMRCPIDRLIADFQAKTGHIVKPTFGVGGRTHQQVARGEPFDVPIVQPPYEDVLQSGHVVTSTETPLATMPVGVGIRKGERPPDLSTPEAVKRLMLSVKSLSYPDGAGGAMAGVIIDAMFTRLGILEQMKPKVKRVQGVSLMRLLTNGDIDVALAFTSEIDDPGVDLVGSLPREIAASTAFVGFVSAQAARPDTAKALLGYLSGTEAAAAYQACRMQPGR
jgi:molybdate transport system substrate-binding protein